MLCTGQCCEGAALPGLQLLLLLQSGGEHDLAAVARRQHSHDVAPLAAPAHGESPVIPGLRQLEGPGPRPAAVSRAALLSALLCQHPGLVVYQAAAAPGNALYSALLRYGGQAGSLARTDVRRILLWRRAVLPLQRWLCSAVRAAELLRRLLLSRIQLQPRLAALRLLLGLGARLFGQLGNQFRPKIMIR